MRIAILTYHRANNIGAVLQAYALQEVITALGGNVEILNYKSDFLEIKYEGLQLLGVRSIKQLIKWVLGGKSKKESKIKFDRFRLKHLNISHIQFNKENISLSNVYYDTFVVGSDQVWNMKLNGNDDNFLLSFVADPNRRFSYAASFGSSNIPRMNDKLFIRELSKFSQISAREEEGKNFITKELGFDCSIVLDPTLLLSNKEWSRRIEISNSNIKKDYILLYTVAPGNNIQGIARRLAKENGYDVYHIHYSDIPTFGFKDFRGCAPSEFLSLVRGAKLILTTSFHGFCFGLIFNKKTFFELDGNPINNNSRITTLSNLMNLNSFEIKDGNIDLHNEPDFNEINIKLKVLRESSINYIKKMIKHE